MWSVPGGPTVLLVICIGNMSKAEARILIAFKGGVQVEVADVESGKSCILTRDNAVNFFLASSSDPVGMPTLPR